MECFIFNCQRAITDWYEKHMNGCRIDLEEVSPKFVNMACDCFYGMFYVDYYGDSLPFFCTQEKNNKQLSIKVYDSQERDSFTFDVDY